MSMTQTRSLWVAYGRAGAVGSIRRDDDGFAVTMVGESAPIGSYPTLEIAKGALCSHLKPGSPRPEFRRH
ncbi:methyltransferase [Microbacterium sp. Marseille-Q6965]|uniref:methyltransferase n=1 Tax=Microbacterium sp. Marseille-Q6965 TaxID=2965072 RepID=UPI0021B74410|nr:methyltransferase [Microbacterium sp. Marseille-Q6965]